MTKVLLMALTLPTAFASVAITKASVDNASQWASVTERFNAWKILHGKVYATATEEAERLKIFGKLALHVDKQNARFDAGEITHHSTLNFLSDLSSDEMSRRRGLRRSQERTVASKMFNPWSAQDKGPAWDWRSDYKRDGVEVNPITYVKDQGQCGSCWAFSVTGAIEAAAAIANRTFRSWYDVGFDGYSEKEISDCAPLPNEGCNGGYMDVAMDWVRDNGGLNTEEDYPYQDLDARCNWQKKAVSVLALGGRQKVPVSSPAMIAAISTTPVSIGIDASSPDFQTYDYGVFASCGHTEDLIDHGVLAVGYSLSADNASGFVMVKNSWSGEWGDGGYIKISYRASLDNGTCGMNLEANIPTGAQMHAPNPMPPPPPQCNNRTKGMPIQYCEYNTTCCCDKKDYLGRCMYSCCPYGAECIPASTEAILAGTAEEQCFTKH
mmetsp:Transcript_7101/g.18406  ORF Transcript_7101/g.18406 Transcript_7101/m.18406 type:complete len:438 (+) Transcript_7101:2-1315(+)